MQILLIKGTMLVVLITVWYHLCDVMRSVCQYHGQDNFLNVTLSRCVYCCFEARG
jgi:hypothetical protein